MPPIFESNFSIRKILAANEHSHPIIKVEQNLPPTPPRSEGTSSPENAASPNIESAEQRPGFTFAAMVAMAIRSSPEKRLPLSAIQDWISEHFPYYRKDQHGWQSQVRHTLSTNSCFVKVPRPLDDPGRGNYWALNPAVEDMKVNASSGRLQIDPSSAAARSHFAIHNSAYGGHPLNQVITHGVPMVHPQAPTAVYFPTPEELGRAQQVMMMQSLQEQHGRYVFHQQQKQLIQQQLLQMQQQQQFQQKYEQLRQQMLFHQQQCEYMMAK